MKIYDITQEVFSSKVYPGDPSPKKETLSSLSSGAICELSAFSMCAHNGTHVDAPLHFIAGGKTVDELSLSSLIGLCFVAEGEGEIGKAAAEKILCRARQKGEECARRILLKGPLFVSEEGARAFLEAGVLLLGNESQTVGPENTPMAVHLLLLGGEVVLLEGVRLASVPEGRYLLHAAPLCLGGVEGAPCRATLLDPDEIN